MLNISGFGYSAVITASKTFPNSFTLVDFADDGDPLDSPELPAADTGFGLNGDMLVWTHPQGVEVTFMVIPTSEGDINLDILLDANRVGKKKTSARDIINIVHTYPNGDVVTLSNGVIISGNMLPGVAGSGRLKSRPYKFRFERITKSRAPVATV